MDAESAILDESVAGHLHRDRQRSEQRHRRWTGRNLRSRRQWRAGASRESFHARQRAHERQRHDRRLHRAGRRAEKNDRCACAVRRFISTAFRFPAAWPIRMLELHDANGATIASNDNWRSDAGSRDQRQHPRADGRSRARHHLDTEPGKLHRDRARRRTARPVWRCWRCTISISRPPRTVRRFTCRRCARKAGTTSQGSGTAILRLAADGQSAILSFNFSNLSSPVTGMHIHGTNGTIWFDIDAATPQPDGSYIWVFRPVGSTTVADIVAAIKAGDTYINIHTSNYPSGEIKGFFTLASGAQVAPVPTPPPALPGGTPTADRRGAFPFPSNFRRDRCVDHKSSERRVR